MQPTPYIIVISILCKTHPLTGSIVLYLSPASLGFSCIDTLPSAVICLGRAVCALWLSLPQPHLWLPVARGFTSFHNSHLPKDACLDPSVPPQWKRVALKLKMNKGLEMVASSFSSLFLIQLVFRDQWCKTALFSFCDFILLGRPLCTLVTPLSCGRASVVFCGSYLFIYICSRLCHSIKKKKNPGNLSSELLFAWSALTYERWGRCGDAGTRVLRTAWRALRMTQVIKITDFPEQDSILPWCRK